jgi:hypothetical protein
MTAVQVATLLAAAIAALSAISGVVITAVTSARRDRSGWLRDQQAEAYEEFAKAAWSYVDELTNGAVDRALQRHGFVGLDEARDELTQHIREVQVSQRRVLVMGRWYAVYASMLMQRDLTDLAPLAYPLRGAVPTAALEQRRRAIAALSDAVVLVASAFRADLGVMSLLPRLRLRRELRRWGRHGSRVPLPTPEDAGRYLLAWQVRNWDGHVPKAPLGYVNGKPPMYKGRHEGAGLPKAAAGLLVKRPDHPWRAALSPGLTATRSAYIQHQMAQIVVHGGRVPLEGEGGEWNEGPAEGERFWRWEL